MRAGVWMIIGASAALLSACGGGGTPTAAPAAGPSSAAPTPTPSPTPSRPLPTHRPTPARTATHHATVPRTHHTATTTVVHSNYVFPVRGCSVNYAHSHHDYPATDIMAPRGCAVVAVTNGRVDEVSYTDTWNSKKNDGATRGGLSISIVGDDGVRYYGSHLEDIANGIAPGAHVKAGQLLGRVGNTGDARGGPTHLHFGLSWPTGPDIWWVRRGMVYPWSYLDSWRAGGQKSPVAAVAALHAQDGDVPPCRVDC
ncbi:MAG: M23 family metallopeptidase [Actinomycetes bacterium]